MTLLKGSYLYDHLDDVDSAWGVFGICYSVLTWEGVAKGFSPMAAGTWLKTVGKLVEDGHATTFLFENDLFNGDPTIVTTGISDEGWEFEEGDAVNINWARRSSSATTYVYYICVTAATGNRYRQLMTELQGTATCYAAIIPNHPLVETHYQNCVSHSQYLMAKLGLASWANQSNGWWVPSISNWMDWFKSFIPVSRHGYKWQYTKFQGVNTHIPEKYLSQSEQSASVIADISSDPSGSD